MTFTTVTSTAAWSTSTTSDYIIVNQAPPNMIKMFLKELFLSPKRFAERLKENNFNPDKVFKDMKSGMITINELDEDGGKVVAKMIKEAKANDQVAFKEALEHEKERIEKEFKVIKGGFRVFITKADIDGVVKKSKRKIKSTKIKNFCKSIPPDVVLEYRKAKKLKVFDDFEVLHYDPEDTNVKMTKEERKKDPVLFGTMECSDRYYFIADWIDDYCNLTLSAMIDEIGIDMKDRVLTKDSITNVDCERGK